MTQLNQEQQKAVRHKDGPMLVVAGPGSGKTAVLTEHIRHLITEANVDPLKILALTFSRKAAMEMRRRFLRNMRQSTTEVTFGTFHSVFYNVLRRYSNRELKIISLTEAITILKNIYRLTGDPEADNMQCVQMLNAISLYKNTGRIPHIPGMIAEEFLKIFGEYNKRMKRAGLIDFEDMIGESLSLFLENPEVLKRMRKHYEHILIDEFQDCNRIQYDLLKILGGEKANLFAVGDDDQSIYGFRGAGGDVMQRFLTDHPDCKKVHLLRNYRCAKNVIDLADTFVRGNRQRLEKPKQLPSKFRGNGSVILLKAKDAYAEAVSVYEKICRLMADGVKASDIAILYRSEQCADYLEEYLRDHHLKVMRKHRNTFYEMKTVREALAYLALSQGEHTRSLFYTVLNHPERNLIRECIGSEPVSKAQMIRYYNGDQRAVHVIEKLFCDFDFIRDLPPYAAINYVFLGIGLLKDHDLMRIRTGNKELPDAATILHELCERAKDHETVQSFLSHVETVCKSEATGRESGTLDEIILQTVHASKGLEYDTVFVIGLQEGLFPSGRAVTMEEREEERRLLYVAMTRAKNRLFLCARGSADEGKRYSPFIGELER